MLVHIECQDRLTSGKRVAVVGRPLIDEFAVARGIGQQHPARAAAKGFAHRQEFRSPPLKRPKIACDSHCQLPAGLAVIAQAVKEQLVQDH
jgi:hypothetical protein